MHTEIDAATPRFQELCSFIDIIYHCCICSLESGKQGTMSQRCTIFRVWVLAMTPLKARVSRSMTVSAIRTNLHWARQECSHY